MEDFFILVKNYGIKQLQIPAEILQDENHCKTLIELDPYALMYMPEKFHTPQYYGLVTKNHEILLLQPLQHTVDAKTIEAIIDNAPEAIHNDFFDTLPDKIKNQKLLLEKIALTFLIEQKSLPNYLKKSAIKYKEMAVDELKQAKKSLQCYTLLNQLEPTIYNKKVKI